MITFLFHLGLESSMYSKIAQSLLHVAMLESIVDTYLVYVHVFKWFCAKLLLNFCYKQPDETDLSAANRKKKLAFENTVLEANIGQDWSLFQANVV